MRVLYISNSILPSRTANSVHVMKMCQAIAENGNEVVLIAPDSKEHLEKDINDIFQYYGVKKIFTIKKLWYPNFIGRAFFYALSIFIYLIFNKKFDLVYGRFLFGCYISSLLKNDIIFEAHDPIYERRYFELVVFKKLIKSKNLKKVVVISNALKNIFLKKKILDEKKIIVAHDGADRVKNFNNKINLMGNTKNIKVGYVGNLYKGKGLEVIASINKKVKNDIEFHIIGGRKKDIEFWKNKINKRNVYFYGYVPQSKLSNYINSLDICLLPNQKDLYLSGVGNIASYTSPLKLFDYMSHKKAIIASDLQVLREVLNRKNSILVKSNKSVEWINAIEKLKNANLRKSLSNQALKDSYFYTWSRRANKVL